MLHVTVRNLILFSVVSLALVVTGANFAKHQSVLETLEQSKLEQHMQQFEAAWYDEQGVQHTVVTPRKDGEELVPWATRHKEAVEALKVVFPPKPA